MLTPQRAEPAVGRRDTSRRPTGPGVLRATGITVQFDGVRALDAVTMELRSGEILGLIGPNGAGKTTLVNAVSGFQKATAGRISDDDVDITSLSPHQRARRGLVRTFQAVRLFPSATIAGNVEPAALATARSRRDATARVEAALGLVGLLDRKDEPARGLPHGDERLVGIARAVATQPRYLLLDEPAAGLNDVETAELRRTILKVRDVLGCAVLLIEHDFPLIMAVCDRLHVLDHGQTISEGSPEQVRHDPVVLTAYLGTTGDPK